MDVHVPDFGQEPEGCLHVFCEIAYSEPTFLCHVARFPQMFATLALYMHMSNAARYGRWTNKSRKLLYSCFRLYYKLKKDDLILGFFYKDKLTNFVILFIIILSYLMLLFRIYFSFN